MSQKQSQQTLTQLNSISRQITTLLQSRKKVVDSVITQTSNTRPQISQSYNRQILSHCSQYHQIKKFVQEMTRNQSFFRSMTDQSTGFWETNEKIEKDLEKRLKNLKQIDSTIEQMVEEEIDMAKEIEDIEEAIRGILNRREHDHISRAEPLYMKKQLYITRLQQMKKQKEQVKEQKIFQLTKILQILNQMKKLRKKRIEQCKQPSFNKESMSLFECLSKDIEQLVENKKVSHVNENNQKKMMLLVNETNEKIHRLSRELAETFDAQIKAFQQINSISRTKAESSAFHQKLCGYFQTSEQELLTISERFSKFIEIQNQKSTELNQVLQGINTTEETIKIFENIKQNIETETLRKKQLIEKISRLNKSYAIQKQRRQTINEKQAKVQGLRINISKFQTMLEQAAQQADVRQYKVIHSQLDELSRVIKSESMQLQKIKSIKRQSAKRIYSQTNNIQEEYRDLISEMFPQIWLRDNDFTKDDTISDFEVYMGKLFSRLKILA